MEILVSSKAALQLTVTKTSLQVLKGLMNAYQEDITMLKELKMETDAVSPETQKPEFFIKNEVRRYASHCIQDLVTKINVDCVAW